MSKCVNALRRLFRDLREGVVDELLIDILLSVNSFDTSVCSLSSCSGRISFICTSIGYEVKVHAKRYAIHKLLSCDDLLALIENYCRQCGSVLFLRIRGFILDLYLSSVEKLSHIVKLFSTLGVKNIALKSISDSGVVVEIVSPVNVDIPLCSSGENIIKLDKKLCDIVLSYLLRSILDLNVYRFGIWYKFWSNDDATLT